MNGLATPTPLRNDEGNLCHDSTGNLALGAVDR